MLLTHEVGHLIGGHHKHAVKFGCSPFPKMCGRSIMNHNTPPNQFFFSDKNDRQIREVIDATLP